MNTVSDLIEFPAGFPAKIVGIGGAGLNVLAQIAATELAPVSRVAMHTNEVVLSRHEGAAKLLLGAELTHGLDTGGDPSIGRAAAEHDSARITEALSGAKLVFIIAGLGGGTGGGASPVVAHLAREAGALVIAIVTTPFQFEGQRRHTQANASIQQLKTAADAVICLSNQPVLQIAGEKTSALKTFELANDLLIGGIRAIWRMLTRSGLIRVDFGDLCAVVRGRHSESAFATARGAGETRAREVIESLVTTPLLRNGEALAEAESLLVSVTGGPDLTMAEINWLMEQLNRHTDQANVVMGASVDPQLEGRIEVMVIASRRDPDAKNHAAIEHEPSAADEGPTPRTEPEAPADDGGKDVEAPRPDSLLLGATPEFALEKAAEIPGRRKAGKGRGRSSATRWRQGQLPLEMVSKGRFDKSEPTLHGGEDLDVPTYIRRGVILN